MQLTSEILPQRHGAHRGKKLINLRALCVSVAMNHSVIRSQPLLTSVPNFTDPPRATSWLRDYWDRSPEFPAFLLETVDYRMFSDSLPFPARTGVWRLAGLSKIVPDHRSRFQWLRCIFPAEYDKLPVPTASRSENLRAANSPAANGAICPDSPENKTMASTRRNSSIGCDVLSKYPAAGGRTTGTTQRSLPGQDKSPHTSCGSRNIVPDGIAIKWAGDFFLTPDWRLQN